MDENYLTNPQPPYGKTKLQTEEILTDLVASDKDWRIISLRFFNPICAHESWLIGEDLNGIPNNLMPYITQVGLGFLDRLKISSIDYGVIDGEGVRDYFHAMDLAEGCNATLNDLTANSSKCLIVNLGTGGGYSGYSILELDRLYEE